MKTLKKITALLLVAASLSLFTACKKNDGGVYEEDEISFSDCERENKLRIAIAKNETSLIVAKLAVNRAYAYEAEFLENFEQSVLRLEKGEADAAVLTPALAAKVYNHTNGGVQIIAVGSLPSLRVISKDKSVTDLASLRGKTVVASGEGEARKCFLNQILLKNGIDPKKDADIRYKTSTAAALTAEENGEADIFALPEPAASKLLLKNESYFRAVDLSEEWSKSFDFPFVDGCVVARTEYVKNNPELIDELKGFCETSVNYLDSNPEAGCLFLFKNQFFEDVKLAKSVLEGARLRFMEGEEMKNAVSKTLEVLFKADSQYVGGALPGDEFYYGV